MGYAALDQYQPLGEEGDDEEEEGDDEEEDGDDEEEDGEDEQRTESVGGEGWPAGVVDVDTSEQPDVREETWTHDDDAVLSLRRKRYT